jgi:hypothetical protein
MVKSVIILKFLKTNRYVIHPELTVKDSGSYAIPPYVTEFDLSTEKLLDNVLYTLDFSKEGVLEITDSKIRVKEYLKGMGVKTLKDIYKDSFSLDVYVKDNEIKFTPWKNKGAKEGFSGFEEDLSIKLPFNSPKEELVKALELALSRCE